MRPVCDPTRPSGRSGILQGVQPRSPRLFALAAVVAIATVLAACGGSGDGDGPAGDAAPAKGTGTAAGAAASTPRSGATGARALAAAPAALRVNAADANTIRGTGEAGLSARLAKLRGHPVVVNQWASWCGPCRAEFPLFADAVVEHGDRVAFLGIDFTDERDAAERLLRESPPGFASVFDPEGDAARSLGTQQFMPTTYFVSAAGKVVHAKFGGYPHAQALQDDIRRHALGSR